MDIRSGIRIPRYVRTAERGMNWFETREGCHIKTYFLDHPIPGHVQRIPEKYQIVYFNPKNGFLYESDWEENDDYFNRLLRDEFDLEELKEEEGNKVKFFVGAGRYRKEIQLDNTRKKTIFEVYDDGTSSTNEKSKSFPFFTSLVVLLITIASVYFYLQLKKGNEEALVFKEGVEEALLQLNELKSEYEERFKVLEVDVGLLNEDFSSRSVMMQLTMSGHQGNGFVSWNAVPNLIGKPFEEQAKICEDDFSVSEDRREFHFKRKGTYLVHIHITPKDPGTAIYTDIYINGKVSLYSHSHGQGWQADRVTFLFNSKLGDEMKVNVRSGGTYGQADHHNLLIARLK